VLRITGFLDSVYRLEFQILENIPFRKLDLFRSSGEGKETPTLLGALESENMNHLVQAKVKVTFRATISRPVRLGVRRPSGTRDQFFYLLEIFF
jgi:hypothetical protein